MVEEGRFDETLRTTVRHTCIDIIDDPMRSDVVYVSELADSDPIQQQLDLTDSGRRSRIGRVLTHADYAEKIARNKYRVDLEAG